MKIIKNIFPAIIFAVLPTLVIWGVFYFKVPEINRIPLPVNGMETVVANYDGPLYLVVAKTLYDSNSIKNNFQFPLPVEYYAAHFPLFPYMIRVVGLVVKNFPYAMLGVTLFGSICALFFFNKLMRNYVSEVDAFWLTFVFSIFPARWLIVRSIGSPEPLFLASVIASVYYYDKKKFLLAGVFGAVAAMTKSPGVLLFVAYFGATFFPRIAYFLTSGRLGSLTRSLNLGKSFLLLIPLALIAVFYIYKLKFGNFFAYFNSGDNIHLMFPPFQIFNYSAPWVGTFWLEEVIFVYLFGAMGLVSLIKEKRFTIAWFVGIFFSSILFVAHRDLTRYALPIVPFLYVAFSKYLVSKEFKIVFLLLIIPVFLFSLSFIANNVMPISNWAPFL